MSVQVETSPSERASGPIFCLAGHSGVLHYSRFRLKGRLRWMSRLACRPFNCGTSADAGSPPIPCLSQPDLRISQRSIERAFPRPALRGTPRVRRTQQGKAAGERSKPRAVLRGRHPGGEPSAGLPTEGRDGPFAMINGLLRPRPPRRVHDQVNDLDITQHSQNLVVQAQLLLPAQTLYAIEHQVDVVAQTLRLLSARVLRTLRTALTIKRRGGPVKGWCRLVQQRNCCVRWACVRHGLAPSVGIIAPMWGKCEADLGSSS